MRIVAKTISAIVLIALLGSLSGCYSMMSEYQQFEIGVRNKYQAHRAWMRVGASHCQGEHSRHFRDGFKQGYIAAANNKDACPPSLPPQKYWSVRYQNPAGREKVHAWFEGYSYGILEANADGIHYYSEIPTHGLNHHLSGSDVRHDVWVEGEIHPTKSREPFPVPESESAPAYTPDLNPQLPSPDDHDNSAMTSRTRASSGYRHPTTRTTEAQWAGTSSSSPVSVVEPPASDHGDSVWKQPKPLFLPNYTTVR